MHELSCFLGQSGSDVDARPDLESCHLSEPGDDSQMPQVILVAFLAREGRKLVGKGSYSPLLGLFVPV